MKLLKTGRFAFDGVHIKDVQNLDELNSLELSKLVVAGWAAEGAQTEEPVEAEQDELTELDLIIQEQDKSALDEYAAGLGVKLDKRKSFAKMLADFKAEQGA